ncbi:hypothetical protein H7K45_12705 [Mycobacterium yunnanensis]|uniref:Polyketide cyclase / dehydrase and lipid transport n=1 Tax=Mycobacterium yunnanensis TaxID=368477 RepID=A0A9X2Z257_9MYCO|nr:hypothetical protein [Mycobacterium yunnanensis]MCV7421404.1 hypothetical protein [Mycobacterium yunnanensis]
MPVIRFRLDSVLEPAAVLAVLTDFSARRPKTWPSIDEKHFEVHGFGDDWAEVTEGTESAWERARYDWNAEAGRVTVTTRDSKVFGPGGGWLFTLTPAESGGTRIDVELSRHPVGVKRKVLAALLKVAAPTVLRKSFAGPLGAR